MGAEKYQNLHTSFDSENLLESGRYLGDEDICVTDCVTK